LIEIFTTKMSITSSGNDLEDTVVDSKEGDIESSTTKIEDNDVLFTGFLVHTVSNGGSGWLVDNPKNIKTSNLTGILGCSSLCIIEISWDSNDGVFDFSSEVSFSNLLHLYKDHC